MNIPIPNAPLFQEELRELLAELDSALLDLDCNQTPDALNRIFRALHTIKGSCDMAGFHSVMELLHDVESLWDRVRVGLSAVSKPLLDITFAVKDWLMPLAENAQAPVPDKTLIQAMRALSDKPAEPAGPAESSGDPAGENDVRECPAGSLALFRVRFAPSDQGHLGKLEPASLLAELRQLGEATVVMDACAVPCLEELNPADCHLRWDIVVATNQGSDAVRDVFLFLDNPADAQIEQLSDVPPGFPMDSASSDAANHVAPEPLLIKEPPQAHSMKAQPQVPGTRKPAPARAPSCQETTTQAPNRPRAKEAAQSLRVEAAKLDNLVNLVGELVIAQARLTQVASGMASVDLTGVAEEIERLVGELRDNTLSIRMMPIGATFSRFRRLVRDLSAELGKEIELAAEGGETELDKTVIEQLGDPLVHLLRNSIDHGVEYPEERATNGKPRRGIISLSAKQAGGAVVIRIADDGHGLNSARIRAKAVERGIIAPDARLPDRDLFQLIFAPGFSTAEKVTSVSGRGVGMDVVKQAIAALRGVIEIDSQPGQGTAITIILPLTLAIIDGLQVRVGGEFYIIPLSMVEECVELSHPALHEGQLTGQRDGCRNRTLSVRGEIIPYLRLRETFQLAGTPPQVEQVVVTRHENERTGIAVDEVIGQQQTVIKGLGRFIGRVEGFSGATINGDGSLALILDVPQLVGSVQRHNDEAWVR